MQCAGSSGADCRSITIPTPAAPLAFTPAAHVSAAASALLPTSQVRLRLCTLQQQQTPSQAAYAGILARQSSSSHLQSRTWPCEGVLHSPLPFYKTMTEAI